RGRKLGAHGGGRLSEHGEWQGHERAQGAASAETEGQGERAREPVRGGARATPAPAPAHPVPPLTPQDRSSSRGLARRPWDRHARDMPRSGTAAPAKSPAMLLRSPCILAI